MNKREKQFIENMHRLRGLDFPRIGMMVEVEGEIGTIVGMNDSANLDVVFANRMKFGNHPSNCHPFWQMKYFDKDGNLIVEFKDGRKG